MYPRAIEGIVAWTLAARLALYGLALAALNIAFGFRFSFSYSFWQGTIFGEFIQFVCNQPTQLSLPVCLLVAALALALFLAPAICLPTWTGLDRRARIQRWVVAIVAPSMVPILAIPSWLIPGMISILLVSVAGVLIYAYIVALWLTRRPAEGERDYKSLAALAWVWIGTVCELLLLDWLNMFVIGAS